MIKSNKHKSKDKLNPRISHEFPQKEQRYNFTLPLTSAQGGGFSTPRVGRFTPGKESSYPL